MTRRSDERRAKRRAEMNEAVARLSRRIFGPDARESELAVLRAETRAVTEILQEHGLTPVGVCQVGANAAGFANQVLANPPPELQRPRACAAGCWWCCILEISAWPIEVLTLAAFIESQHTSEEVAAIAVRLRDTVAKRDAEDAAGRAPRTPCPLLGADLRCSVYDGRPSSCAAVEAPDATLCREYAQGADDATEGLVVVPIVHVPAEAAARMIAERGGPAIPGTGSKVDFHSGLAATLELGPEAVAAAWLSGADPFKADRERLERRHERFVRAGIR